jgi:hypothetical protein
MEFRMKRAAIAILFLGFVISIDVRADTQAPPNVSADESQLVEHNHYVNKDGQEIHAPAHSKSGAVPAGATARCGDGTYSFSQNHRGTCSHHGGVTVWLH